NMANAISSRTVQKGLDPREFALVAFGGAGPLHGAELARALGIPEVIVPAYPGITSAVGLLTTDLKYDAVRTEFQAGDTVDLDRLDTDLTAMQRDLMRQLAADGLASDDAVFERAGDLRYVGQGYELRVAFSEGKLDRTALAQIFARFAELHRAEYGHVFEESPIEIVNIRVTGIGRMPKIAAPRPAKRRQPRQGADQDRALRVPPQRCPRSQGDAVLPAQPIATGATDRRTGNRAANRFDDGRSAGDDADRRIGRQSNSVGTPIGTAGIDGSTLRNRQHHCERRAGRAREHRDGNGLQADADVLFVDHPRIRRFRRGAGRCGWSRARRVGAVDAAAIGTDPGLHTRHFEGAARARRCRPGGRC